MTDSLFRVLTVGLELVIIDYARSTLSKAAFNVVDSNTAWEEISTSVTDTSQDLIICGTLNLGVNSLEMAQVFHTLCPHTPIYFASTQTNSMQIKNLLKNGFAEAYLFPVDQSLMSAALLQIEQARTGAGKKQFRGVSLIDFNPEEKIDFDVSVFLPVNNKYIKVVKEGRIMPKEKVARFKEHNVAKVFIDAGQMERFYRYTAERLKSLNAGDSKISETERQDRLRASVRQLIMGLFDSSTEVSFKGGTEMMDDVQKVVTDMIGMQSTVDLHSEICKNLAQPLDESTCGARVSTFAALFEMVLGLKQTQQAAIAGLFHNLGMTSLPLEVQNKKPSKMNEAELKVYVTYPEASLRLLLSKRMVITPDIQNAILQHREKFDGRGFPNNLPGHKISRLAQVVAIAVRFDELAFDKESDLLRDPVAIFAKILEEHIADPEVVRPLVHAFKAKAG